MECKMQFQLIFILCTLRPPHVHTYMHSHKITYSLCRYDLRCRDGRPLSKVSDVFYQLSAWHNFSFSQHFFPCSNFITAYWLFVIWSGAKCWVYRFRRGILSSILQYFLDIKWNLSFLGGYFRPFFKSVISHCLPCQFNYKNIFSNQ